MERTSLHPEGLVVRLPPFFQCLLYDSIVFSYTAKVHLSFARCKSKVPKGISFILIGHSLPKGISLLLKVIVNDQCLGWTDNLRKPLQRSLLNAFH